MSFQPVVPVGGLTGWAFLNRTLEKQTAAFDASAALTRDTDYFEANIGKITSAEDLVSDRRLLRVALGAFGLEDDINNRFFIQKILEEGAEDDEALANRLTDTRYRALAEAFGFSKETPNDLSDPDFATDTIEKFRRQRFEIAIGDQDEGMRLAMSLERQLPGIAEKDSSDDAKWFTILGNPPLRKVFETALGFPEGISSIDVDKQVELFRERAQSQFGVSEFSDFSDPELQEKLTQRYFLMDQIKGFSGASSGAIALTLLQSATISY